MRLILHNAINIAFAIILQKKNTCDIDIADIYLAIFVIYCNIAQPFNNIYHSKDRLSELLVIFRLKHPISFWDIIRKLFIPALPIFTILIRPHGQLTTQILLIVGILQYKCNLPHIFLNTESTNNKQDHLFVLDTHSKSNHKFHKRTFTAWRYIRQTYSQASMDNIVVYTGL